MENTNRSEDWRVLCELASKEKDPEKLMNLVVKINQVLAECQNPHNPVDANTASHSLAPQLSQPAESDC